MIPALPNKYCKKDCTYVQDFQDFEVNVFPSCECISVILIARCKTPLSLPESLKQHEIHSCHPSALGTAPANLTVLLV